MGLFARLAGTMSAFFQIGGPNSAGWNDVGAAAIEAKDPTNTTFVVVRGATPVAPNDLVTKGYSDTQFKPIAVGLQFNGSSALPANTATEQFYVVTTSGVNASIGDLLWDNGTGVGNVTVIPVPNGGEIVTTAVLSGGTISFVAAANYAFIAGAWVDLTGTATPGVVQVISYAVAQTTVSSVTLLPAGSIILRATLNVTTGYAPGATLSVGVVGNASAFMGTGDNVPQTVDTYDAPQLTAQAGSAAVTVTVGGAPAVGNATVMVEYSLPNP